MKLTVIGGGGVRSVFLAKSLTQRAKALGIKELVFMDNDENKLKIYGGLAKGAAYRIDAGVKFTLTTDAIEAVKDADYVITTIRVGGDLMRVKDERLALSKGVLGQETTGAAGLSFAMRSIPALLEYCSLIKRYSKPSVKVFNFTNPAGIVSQALRDAGYDFTYGICDAPSGLLHQIADYYGVSPDRVKGHCYGLNHLSFFKSVMLDGIDINQKIIADPSCLAATDLRFFDGALLKKLGGAINEYLYYFYYREKAVENILRAERTRGEQIAEINARMTEELKNLDTFKNFEKALAIFEKWYGMRENNYMASETGVKKEKSWSFDLYSPDAGGYAGVALKYIEIERTGGKGEMILCVPNNGAINGLYDTDVIESTCDIEGGVCRPRPAGEIPEINLELLRRVKIYERLGAYAILHKDTAAAENALMLHPLVNSYSIAHTLTAEYIEHNKPYCGGWK